MGGSKYNKKPGKNGKKGSGLSTMISFLAFAGVLYMGSLMFMKWQYSPKDQLRPPTREGGSESRKSESRKFGRQATSDRAERRSKQKQAQLDSKKHASLEWASLPRDMPGCLSSQEELMTIPVPWPGFHALCIDSAPSAANLDANAGDESITVMIHRNSGVPHARRTNEGAAPRPLTASSDGAAYDSMVSSLIKALKAELLETEFDPTIDPMVSNSAYDFVPNPWKLFTSRGEPVETDADLSDLGRGAALYLYTGGQFIWPGVRLGHKIQVPIPVTDGTPGGHKLVEMETLSLRPLVLALSGAWCSRDTGSSLDEPPLPPLRLLFLLFLPLPPPPSSSSSSLSFVVDDDTPPVPDSPPPTCHPPPPSPHAAAGFLSDDECAFIQKYASTRMVPSGLAMMDSSGDSRDVRTSTQTFMERNGSPQIRALEERAHNLTRLPYDLGENIQVVRYEVGQKYGAHRDFFNPNDYHKQPAMLRSVEYGARNRLATVFWYLETVTAGGETFFPRALNAAGQEYHPWNGDHEDCYRGLYVPPVRGNAVLFYSMVPDGRLDERSLHGGCKPRGKGVEKWGANQWIWNHPQRNTGVAPRKGARIASSRRQSAGCEDSDENCAAWAASGGTQQQQQQRQQQQQPQRHRHHELVSSNARKRRERTNTCLAVCWPPHT